MVPGGPAEPGFAEARLVRLVGHRRPGTRTRGSSSSTASRRTGRGIRWPGPYYWHRFFSHQPDLNYDNPEVQDAMLKVLRFWLDLGSTASASTPCPTSSSATARTARTCRRPTSTSSGCARRSTPRYPDTRAARRGEPVAAGRRRLLRRAATSATWPSTSRSCPACSWRCGARTRRRSTRSSSRRPRSRENCQWGLFLRNHDELTLEMVTDEERDYMYAEYAKDPRMKLNLGIRRRLAPLLDNGRGEIELMHRDPVLAARHARSSTTATRSAWATTSTSATATACARRCSGRATATAGFSRADFAQLYLPPSMDPVYGYQAVNVEAQLRTPTSLLRWIHRFIAAAQGSTRSSASGTYELLRAGEPPRLRALRTYEEDVVLCVHNLARSAQPVELDLSRFEGRVPEEMFGRTRFPASAGSPTRSRSRPVGSSGSSSERTAMTPDRVLAGELDLTSESPDRLRPQPALVRLEGGGRSRTRARRRRRRPLAAAAARRCRRRAAVPDGDARAVPAAARFRGRRTSAADDVIAARRRHASSTKRWPIRCSRASSSIVMRRRGRRFAATRRRSSSVPAEASAATARSLGGAPARRRAVEHLGRLRRGADPEGVPAARGRHQPRARGAAVPHRARLPEHRRARRLVLVLGRLMDATLGILPGVRPGRARRLGARARRGPDRARHASWHALRRLGEVTGEMHCALASDSLRPRLRAGGAERRGAGAARRDRGRGDRADLPRAAARGRSARRRSRAAARRCASGSGRSRTRARSVA